MDGEPVGLSVARADGVGVSRGVSVAPVVLEPLTESEPDEDREARIVPLDVRVGGGFVIVTEVDVDGVEERVA